MPSLGERIAIGAVLGVVASFALSDLVIVGITPTRVLGCALGAIIGAIVYVKWRRAAWTLLVAALAAWCVVAFTPLSRTVSAGLVRSDPIPSSVDAVVVLSGSVTDDGMLGREALDRLLRGMELVRAGKSSTIVITQPHPLEDSTVTTDADQRRLIALLPTAPRVVVIDRVVSTRTEALGAARQLPPSGTRVIALVTSPLHTRRACRVFEHVGYTVVCVPSQSRDIALRTLSTAGDRVAAFQMAIYERLAFAMYSYRAWL
ncbi:MAG: YdcF family protein [Gemmatimonadaceae bacterium]